MKNECFRTTITREEKQRRLIRELAQLLEVKVIGNCTICGQEQNFYDKRICSKCQMQSTCLKHESVRQEYEWIKVAFGELF